MNTQAQPSQTANCAAGDEQANTVPTRTIYPGHPCLIAMQIMDNFPTMSDASERTAHGWPEALSCSNVRGAGGAVYQGLSVLRKLCENPSDIDGAFAFGSMLWERSRQSDHPGQFDEGVAEASKWEARFHAQAKAWLSHLEVPGEVEA